ncbi:hypothetical protein ACVWWG_009562, partial [Bradyrhizobium sp. LB7.2]
ESRKMGAPQIRLGPLDAQHAAELQRQNGLEHFRDLLPESISFQTKSNTISEFDWARLSAPLRI